MCGMKAGCQDFVFEPASGTCVLLPHVADSSKVIESHNEYTVAGSLQITVVKSDVQEHGECEFQPSSGYSGGQLGEAQPLPGDEPIASKQDCCDACERDPQCAKFTYETYGKTCMLFAGYAENYRTDGLLSGVVSGRSAVSALQSSIDVSDAPGGDGGKGNGDNGADLFAWMMNPPPPVPPMLTFGVQSPPPSPPPGELEATKIIVADASMFFVSVMGLGFCICAYCFFREDLISVAHRASGGKVGGKKGSKRQHAAYGVAPTEDDAEAPGGPARKGKKGKKGKRGQRTEEGYAHVRLETRALTQKKEVRVAEVEDLASLYTTLWSEFPSALKDTRPDQMVLLSEGAEYEVDAGGHLVWQRVTTQSDILQVLVRGSLKLTERADDFSEDDFAVAFPMVDEHVVSVDGMETGGGGRNARKSKPGKNASKLGSRAVRDGAATGASSERFADDDLDDEGIGKTGAGMSNGETVCATRTAIAPTRFADDDDDSADDSGAAMGM